MAWKKNFSAEDKQEYQKARREEVDGLCQQLEEGIDELRQSDRYLEYLRAMGRFHRYSYANTLLILKACPHASHVAGFSEWKKLGRSVRRGEKSIRILAPLIVPKTGGEEEKDGTPAVMLAGFRPVSVFDISQTEGKPLPQLASPLTADVDGYEDLFGALVEAEDATVCRQPLPDGVYGMWDTRTGIISLEEDISQAQAIKTLIHELAHRRMHAPRPVKPRPVREIEAESVAYVTCAHFGLDTKEYSFGYLDAWMAGQGSEVLKKSLGDIAKNAHDLISGTEAVLERQKERAKGEQGHCRRPAALVREAPGREVTNIYEER